jgi:signal transduction histidine kinase
MEAMKHFLESLQRKPLRNAAVIAVCLAVVQVAIDWLTRIEFNEAIVYTMPLVIAGISRSRRLLWALVICLICTTFTVYWVQIKPGAFSLLEPLFINRVLAAITMVVTSGLLHAWISAVDSLQTREHVLKIANDQLDALNRELVRCRDEITAQNEELEHRRQEAEDASSRKSRLLASVSHDMRSPLHALSLTAELIRRTADDQADTGEISELAELLQKNALGLADLVSDVLDISSIDSGRSELHESEFSLNELMTEQCRRLGPLAEARHLTLGCQPLIEPISLRTDRVKLARILNNLISNAIKFTKSGGITVVSELTNDAIVIRVRDTGIGISSQHLDRVFDEFSQIYDPQNNRSKGWGLGLAICRRLIDLLGGAITVESQYGLGTTFSVHVPSACVVDKPQGVVPSRYPLGTRSDPISDMPE